MPSKLFCRGIFPQVQHRIIRFNMKKIICLVTLVCAASAWLIVGACEITTCDSFVTFVGILNLIAALEYFYRSFVNKSK